MAFVALIVSILSWMSGSISSIKTWREAERANETAEKAYQLARTEFESQLIPLLSLECFVSIPLSNIEIDDNEREETIFIEVRNEKPTRSLLPTLVLLDISELQRQQMNPSFQYTCY
ncbi:MAG: hypothetical protein WDO14_14165 [Bacteroidota bacterium]